MKVPVHLHELFQEAFLRSINDLQDGLIVLKNETLVFANASFQRWMKKNSADLEKLSAWDALFEKKDRPLLRQFLSQKEKKRHRVKLPGRSGAFLELQKILEEAPEGHHFLLVHFLAPAEDKRTEESAFSWFSKNPHPMLIYEVGSLRIQAANEAAVRQYGFSEKEFQTMTLRDLWVEPEDDTVFEDLTVVTKEYCPLPRRVRHRRRGKEPIYVETLAHGITYRGQECRLMLILNVSAKVEAEKSLQYRQFLASKWPDLYLEMLSEETLSFEAVMKLFLRRLADVTGDESGFVFLFNTQKTAMDFVCEWSREGIPLHQKQFQNYPISMKSWFFEKINAFEPIIINHLNEIPEESRELVRDLGVKSFAAVPLKFRGSAVGFFGLSSYDHPRSWRPEEVAFLEQAADLVVFLWRRANSREQQRFKAAALEKLWMTAEKPLFLLNAEGAWVDGNINALDWFESFFSRKPDDTFSVLEAFDRKNFPHFREVFQKAVRGEMRSVSLGEKEGMVQFVMEPVWVEGQCHGVRVAVERTHAEDEKKFMQYKHFFDSSGDLLFVARRNDDGRPVELLDANAMALQRLGYAKKDLLKTAPDTWMAPEGNAEHFWHAVHLTEGKFPTFEKTYKTHDGREFPVEIHVSTYSAPGGPYLFAVAKDITEKKMSEETLRRQAYYDPLTNLPNRTLFRDRLSQAMAHAKRNRSTLAVLLLDVDRFKTINETLGHEWGDKLLVGVAERLMGELQEGETLARLGGDEFVFLFPQVHDVEEIAHRARAVLSVLQKPFRLGEHDLHLTTSMGIALYPNDGQEADTLLKNAEVAMYRAKEQGRNNYQMYTAVMNTKVFNRLVLENSLRRAIERNEFVVYYQPQVEVKTGRIIGMEALVRWRHPDLSLIFPTEFIGVAEETGLILPLGELVLETACRQTRTWSERGYTPLRVSVNLSARQFTQPNLAWRIEEILKKTGLPPHQLELEITESIAMRDAEFSAQVLHTLRKMGVKTALDDFGTGYSSLSYLKILPIDTLKIDRSFVNDVLDDPNDAAIVKAILALAASLKLSVVAEGVEKEEQLNFLKAAACPLVQGYWVSHPLPAEEFEELLKKENVLGQTGS